eukprot:1145401-Pelagomonas_calceolata.AAC.17
MAHLFVGVHRLHRLPVVRGSRLLCSQAHTTLRHGGVQAVQGCTAEHKRQCKEAKGSAVGSARKHRGGAAGSARKHKKRSRQWKEAKESALCSARKRRERSRQSKDGCAQQRLTDAKTHGLLW